MKKMQPPRLPVRHWGGFGLGAMALVLVVGCGSDRVASGLSSESALPVSMSSAPSTAVQASAVLVAPHPDSAARILATEFVAEPPSNTLVIYDVGAEGALTEISRTDSTVFGGDVKLTEDGRFAFAKTYGDDAHIRYVDLKSGAVAEIACVNWCGVPVVAGGAKLAWLEGTSMVAFDLAAAQEVDRVALPAMPWPTDGGPYPVTAGPDLVAVHGDRAIAQTTALDGTGAIWPGQLYLIRDGTVEYLGPSGSRAGSFVTFSPDGTQIRYLAGAHSGPCNWVVPAGYDLVAHLEIPKRPTPTGFTREVRSAGFNADGSYWVTASERSQPCTAREPVDEFVEQTWIDNGNGWEGPFDVGMSGRWSLPAADIGPQVTAELWGTTLSVTVNGETASQEIAGTPIGIIGE